MKKRHFCNKQRGKMFGSSMPSLFDSASFAFHLAEEALQIALSKGHFKIVKWIIDKESEVDIRNAKTCNVF